MYFFLNKGITYAGNHGLDIHHSDGSKFTHPLPESQSVEKVQELKKALEKEVCRDGAWVSFELKIHNTLLN